MPVLPLFQPPIRPGRPPVEVRGGRGWFQPVWRVPFRAGSTARGGDEFRPRYGPAWVFPRGQTFRAPLPQRVQRLYRPLGPQRGRLFGLDGHDIMTSGQYVGRLYGRVAVPRRRLSGVEEDCAGVGRRVYEQCVAAWPTSTGKRAQYCTEQSQAAVRDCMAKAAPPPPSPEVATGYTIGAPPPPMPSQTTVQVYTKTPSYEIEIEMPQNGRWAPTPYAMPTGAPTATTEAPPTGPVFTTYGYAPANGFSQMYQPASPEMVPARIDAEEQKKLMDAEKPAVSPLLLIFAGVGAALLLGGQ